nr:hypothetical protein [Tanacetum cinerariifolium]
MSNVKKSVAERTRHQRQYNRWVNKRQMQIRTEPRKQDTSSKSGNDTNTDDGDIKPIYDEEPMAETVVQFQKDFSRMEAHCIALELKYQSQSVKSKKHGQFLKEKSIEAKINKHRIGTINIELKHSVAKLLAENEHLHKENKHMKQTYKDLYDSIKRTRVQMKDHSDSLIAQMNKKSVENADLKALIQDKVFAIAALKNELRKLKGNSVDTKFVKPSVLGKPTLQPLRNQSVVRQANAFKSERPKFSKTMNSRNSGSFSDSKHFVCSACHKCVFNSNHDACITKLLKEVNSRAKIQSHKTRNNNKLVEQKSHIQKGRQIITGHRFSPNKSAPMYENKSPRSCIRWKPTVRIFKSVGLRWIPTGKLFDSCTSKADSESTHGSNVCKQTLDLSTDMIVMTSMIKLESLFGPLFDEYFNGENQVVSKSSAIPTADASDKRKQQPD